MGQEVARLVHHVDHQVLVLDADVDVHAEDQHAPRHVGHLLFVLVVAIGVGDLLLGPARERVGAGGGHLQAVVVRPARRPIAQPDQLLPGLSMLWQI